MLKLVRNTLGDWGVLTDSDSNEIKWHYLLQLNLLQKKQQLHLGNKLTNAHIDYSKQNMKVKLASQVISKSVADSLQYLMQNKVAGFDNCAGTIKFLRVFNSLFDVLNSRSIYGKYEKRALSSANYLNHKKILQEAKLYIMGLKDKSGTSILRSKRKTGFLGFIVCIESAIAMYQKLVEGENGTLKYIPFYKISQDHIERLFGYIRSRGGHNNNPTCKQFSGSIQRIILHKELEESNTGNSLILDKSKVFSVVKSNNEKDEINISTPGYRSMEHCQDMVENMEDDIYVPVIPSSSKIQS